MQYDDKFYDLDDGWICDDDIGLNDDGVADFINESESQSMAGGASTVMRGPNGEALNEEEQRMRRLERKELERISRRFRVITPAEFEKNMAAAGDLKGSEAAGIRPTSDSWCGAANAHNNHAGL